MDSFGRGLHLIQPPINHWFRCHHGGFALPLVRTTKLGKAMRAVAEDKDTAALMGINVNQIITRTFLIGSALAGLAGVMVGMFYLQIRPTMGFVPGIKAFTSAVLGGIGNIPGAMLGGYVLGMAEVFPSSFCQPSTKMSLPSSS